MFDIPKIINTQLTSNNELLLYFEIGIIKKIDINDLITDKKDSPSTDIKFTPECLILNGNPIKKCALWSNAKFCGWSKK